MPLFVSEIINGLVLASFYALVASGLAMIFGVVGIVNFAHGDFVMLAGYFFYEFYVVVRLPYLPAIILTALGAAVIGALTYWIALRRLIAREWYTQLIATLALSVLLENIAQKIWSPNAISVATPFTVRSLRLGSAVNVSVQDLFVFAGTAICLLTLWLVTTRTRSGKAMRAVAQNRDACTVTGINIGRMAMLAFVAGTALCGIAAALVLPLQDVYPTVGLSITTQAFVVVIVGGMGSVPGAAVAAVIIGLVDALTAGYVSSAYTDAFGYAVMILVLLVHPNGLFGDRSQRGWVGL